MLPTIVKQIKRKNDEDLFSECYKRRASDGCQVLWREFLGCGETIHRHSYRLGDNGDSSCWIHSRRCNL